MRNTPLDTLDVGTYNILDNNIFLVVAAYETQGIEKKPSEKHTEYIDLHYVLSGEEYLGHGYHHPKNTVIQEYSTDNDCILYSSVQNENFVLLQKGMFALCLPHDAHRPGLHTNGVQQVKKVVVKIKHDLLHTRIDQELNINIPS